MKDGIQRTHQLRGLLTARAGKPNRSYLAGTYVARYYEPTGNLKIPVLRMHTTRDPSVPYRHETVFAQKVLDAGASAMLRTRPINRFGHCTFNTNEMVGALQDLATWSQTGIAPAN